MYGMLVIVVVMLMPAWSGAQEVSCPAELKTSRYEIRILHNQREAITHDLGTANRIIEELRTQVTALEAEKKKVAQKKADAPEKPQ